MHLQLLLIQLRLIFFAISFDKLCKVLNQKKLCLELHSKKVLCIRARSLII